MNLRRNFFKLLQEMTKWNKYKKNLLRILKNKIKYNIDIVSRV